MTMLEFVSASTPWIFALRDRYAWRRISLSSGASRMSSAATLVVLGVLFALPTWGWT